MFDLWLGDGGDVVKPGLGQILDLAALDHPAVPHQGDPLTSEALAGLLHLGAKRGGVLRVAAKDFAGNRLALLVAQQADDHLFFAFLAVAVVAVGPQGVVVSFQIAAGHIVEKQLWFACSTPGGKQLLLDGLLVLAQPSEIGVQIIFIKATAHAQDLGGGMRLSQAHGGEARSLIEHAGQDLPERQTACEVGTEGRVDAQVASGLKERPDGTDRGALEELDLVERSEDGEVALVLGGSSMAAISRGSQWVRLAISRLRTWGPSRKDSRR